MTYTYPLFKDKQWLEDEYVNGNLKVKELCEIANCSYTTILKYVELYMLPKRHPDLSERQRLYWDTHQGTRNGRRKFIDLELLKIEYVDNKNTVKFLCNKFDSDYSTIKKCLDELNITIRPSCEYKIGVKLSPETCAKRSAYHKGRPHPWQLGDLNPSKRPDVRAKISAKTKGVRKPQTSGPKNGNWHGGISSEEYTINFNEYLREEIRYAFDYKCVMCGNTRKENNNRLLPIHHIDYNKQNNNKDNLVPVCNRCHGKMNTRRDYWFNEIHIRLFARKLCMILGFECEV